MANTTEEEYDQLVKLSFANLVATKPASYALFSAGFLAFTTNIVVIVVIYKGTNLHNRCFWLIANLAAADWMVGLSYMIVVIKRGIRLMYNIHEVKPQIYCALEMFFPYLGQNASITIALTIALDRMVAICFPTFYTIAPRKQGVIFALVAWLYAFLDAAAMFIGLSTSKLVANCMLVSSVTNTFYKFQSYHKQIQATVITVIYGGIMSYLHYDVKKAEKQGHGNMAQLKKKHEMKVGRMLALIGCLYLITQIVAWGILGLFSHLPADVRAGYGPFIRPIILLNSGVNLFIYVKMSTEFRTAFDKLRGKNNAVAPTNHHIEKRAHNARKNMEGVESIKENEQL